MLLKAVFPPRHSISSSASRPPEVIDHRCQVEGGANTVLHVLLVHRTARGGLHPFMSFSFHIFTQCLLIFYQLFQGILLFSRNWVTAWRICRPPVVCRSGRSIVGSVTSIHRGCCPLVLGRGRGRNFLSGSSVFICHFRVIQRIDTFPRPRPSFLRRISTIRSKDGKVT